MAEELSFVGTEFDIFGRNPKQSRTVETNETIYRPIASVDQTDKEFVIPCDSDTYVHLDLELFVKRKLQTEDNADLPETDYTAVINNLLHSLFSQCTMYLNGTQITQATELYPYRAYIETLVTYGNYAANSHLLDEGNMLGGDSSKPEQTNNSGFCTRCNRHKESQTVEMYGRLHSDICNVPLFLLNTSRFRSGLQRPRNLSTC